MEQKNRSFLPFDPLELASKLSSIKVPNEVAYHLPDRLLRLPPFQIASLTTNLVLSISVWNLENGHLLSERQASG